MLDLFCIYKYITLLCGSGMVIHRYPKSLHEILNQLEYLINRYYFDMLIYADLTIPELFDLLSKDITYRPDEPKGHEVLMRPRNLFIKGAGDCDDKTIAAACYFRLHGITNGYSLVSQSLMRNYHHIFNIFEWRGVMYDFDATYPHNELLKRVSWAKRVNKIIFKGEAYV